MGINPTDQRVKLTDSEVAEIRHAYRVKKLTQCSLAERFGVGQQYISKLVNGENR